MRQPSVKVLNSIIFLIFWRFSNSIYNKRKKREQKGQFPWNGFVMNNKTISCFELEMLYKHQLVVFHANNLALNEYWAQFLIYFIIFLSIFSNVAQHTVFTNYMPKQTHLLLDSEKQGKFCLLLYHYAVSM